jgi:hypothetical protein
MAFLPESATKAAPIFFLSRAHIVMNEMHEMGTLTVIKRLIERLGCVGDLLQGG